MDGDSLPVSAFVGMEDGQFPQGAAAYEKRGVAVSAPLWHAENCIQCNQCAFVCPHAAIRPFAMTADEAAAAPEGTAFAAKPVVKTDYKFTIAVSPLDCMGCTLCVKTCPVTNKALKDGTPEKAAIEMVSQSRTSPRRRSSSTTPLRAASSSSPCLSSPAPAQAVQRPPMLAS